jgi:hypothetical protein
VIGPDERGFAARRPQHEGLPKWTTEGLLMSEKGDGKRAEEEKHGAASIDPQIAVGIKGNITWLLCVLPHA